MKNKKCKRGKQKFAMKINIVTSNLERKVYIHRNCDVNKNKVARVHNNFRKTSPKICAIKINFFPMKIGLFVE